MTASTEPGAIHGVESICRVLRATDCGFIPPQAGGAPTSRGYRAAKTRPRCARAIRDDVLVEEVKRLHAQNYGVYGHRKMWHAMRRRGWMIGRDQTARLMKVAGLHGVRRGRRPFTTVGSKLPDHRPDLVERDFHAMAPNELWVADITYVRTVGGFAYTAFITDACTRKIVGWSVASSLTTQALPLIALQQAITTTPAARQGGRLVHHSDRGVQGGFNWLSQHPDREGVWWDEIQRNQRRWRVRVDSGKRIGRSDRSCGRRGIRSTAGMSSQRSGIR
ncbi:integrase-like protein [Dermacoccus sp. SAI-028]|nr:integrase-like protein [Dermacoccus sp. SAI-028]